MWTVLTPSGRGQLCWELLEMTAVGETDREGGEQMSKMRRQALGLNRLRN